MSFLSDTSADIIPVREMIVLNAYEKLEDMAAQSNVEIIQRCFESDRIKGLYCDSMIALSDSLKATSEKACVLAEELGHYHTTIGCILDQQDISNRKQERRARVWAYDLLIDLPGIVKAYKHGCSNLYEMADYLEVTEGFLRDALERYRQKYGIYTTIGHYIIYFEPYLAVAEMLSDG